MLVPPPKRYLICPGTSMQVLKDGQWVNHQSHDELVFDDFVSHQRGYFVFQHEEWQIQIRDDLVDCGDGYPHDGKIYYAIEFEIQPDSDDPNVSATLIVPLNGRCESPFTRPADETKLLIEIGRGDDVIHSTGTRRVLGVSPYRVAPKN